MKKLLTAVLATALVVSVATVPVSAAPTDNSVAGISFQGGKLEPGDPGDPDQKVDGVEHNLNLYFGSQEISSADKSYASQNKTEAPYDGKGEKVGYIVTNNTGSTAQGWELTVEIGEFTLVDGGAPTMQGFTLDINPEIGYPKAAAGTSTTNNDAPTAAAISLTAGAGSAQTLFSATAGNGRGTWGANWTGKLNVLGGTANAGAAQAAMIWNLQAV